MYSTRDLIVIDAVCLCLILWALAVKISRPPQYQALFPDRAIPNVSRPTLPVSKEAETISSAKPSQNVISGPAANKPIIQREPTISAEAYLVGDIDTGEIYLEQNGTAALPVASMSKLVTAIVVTDTIPASTTVVITPEEAALPQDGSGLMAGERFGVNELMYPLLLDSSNIAAEAMASAVDRTDFINKMNSYSWEVGMPHTYFADPTGLSLHNQATAEDFFNLARYLYKSRPDILSITRIVTTGTASTTEHSAHVFASIHPFVTDPRFIGGKTGHTPEAGDTMLTILWIKGHPIAFVVIGADNGERAADTRMLIQKAIAKI